MESRDPTKPFDTVTNFDIDEFLYEIERDITEIEYRTVQLEVENLTREATQQGINWDLIEEDLQQIEQSLEKIARDSTPPMYSTLPEFFFGVLKYPGILHRNF